MANIECILVMVELINDSRSINPVAYQALVEALPAFVQPQTDEFSQRLSETITGAATRIILFTYLPIFFILSIIIIALSLSGALPWGIATLLIIVMIIIFIVFFFIAMRAYRQTLPFLTKHLQTRIFNFVGIFGGVVYRELLYLATCL